MTLLYYRKPCCWFYASGSGTDQAGGCTKDFLDSQNGDVSTVMGENGEPIQTATVTVTNLLDDETAILTVDGLDENVLPGLIARVDGSFYEVLSTETDTIQIDGWIGTTDVLMTEEGESNSLILLSDDSYLSSASSVHIKGAGDASGTYEIVSLEDGYLEINDGLAIYNSESDGDIYLVAETVSTVEVVIGGAFNDLQTALDVSNAALYDQWIFFNEDIAPSEVTSGAAYYIYSSHDGEIGNNTKLYIVGFNTYAYDCLPTGYGYFPEGTKNTAIYYKPPLERAKDHSDEAIKADLPSASCVNLSGDYERIFRVYTNAENIQFMGIYFEVAIYQWPIIADNESTGSVFVKHCAGGHTSYDATPEFYGGQIVRVNDAATGGGIYDSFFKGVEIFNGTTPTTDNSGDWEFAYNVGIYTGNINPEYSGPVVHHNIFVKSHWGASAVTRSFQNVFNNIFYLCRTAGFNMNGTEGRLRAWNNIIVMDESDSNYRGLFSISAGGTVDYFDYNCYCNEEGQPVSVFAYDGGVNASFNFSNLQKGSHDIEADPMFVDPDNWDFRLNPNSPCLGKGRPDATGTPTTIGPCPVKYTPCINDKAIKFQRVYGWPVDLPEGLTNGAYDD